MRKRVLNLILVMFLSVYLFGFARIGRQDKRKLFSDTLAKTYFSINQEFTPEWCNAKLEKRVRLITANGDAYLYRVFDDEKQNGFFTIASISSDIDLLEIIMSTTQGEDPLIKNSQAFYYSIPFEFYEENEYNSKNIISVAKKIHKKEMLEERFNKESYESLSSINRFLLPPVPSQYYYTRYYPYYSVQKIVETPEYYNEIIYNGCAPTSGAMLTAFYDRVVPNWDDLVIGIPPLHHDDDPIAVYNLITLMGNYMNSTFSGTNIADMNTGLNEYFNDHGHGDYSVVWSENSVDYKDVIWSGNPAIMAIYTDSSPVPNHAVLGIGTSVTYLIGTRYIVRYNWRSRPGGYSLNPALFYGLSYMSR